jgi:membrane peptidoglycan carboxypeptidase
VRPRFRLPGLRPVVVVVLIGALLAVGLVHESRTSRLQALLLSRLASRLTFAVGSGASPSVILPRGPADERLGYSRLGDFEQNLRDKGFRVTRQARLSPILLQLARRGINPPYHEKSVAGLRLVDRNGQVLLDASNSRHQFESFENVPDPIVPALLFIENRELFNDRFPQRNPAVEWDRLAHAALQYGRRQLGLRGGNEGGSTLATQIEKYRHAPGGLTTSPVEKLRQMTSASLRAYQNGPDTREIKREIVLDYLNTVPLAAVPGHGEVNGLGEAMWAWFGKDLKAVRADLAEPEEGPGLQRRAETTRQLLALLVSNRAPSDYLVRGRDRLDRRVDLYLDLMASAGILSPAVRDAARGLPLKFRTHAPEIATPPFAERKAANAVRSQLLGLLGETRFYRLDRLDLAVTTTLDAATQRAVTAEIMRLTDPKVVEAEGLRQFRLLEHGDPSQVIYSFTLYECLPEVNVLRVQADNLGQPFDVNEGMKLDLGSTAKLRTLAHYLMIVADLSTAEIARRKSDRAAGTRSPATGLAATSEAPVPPRLGDPLSRWVAEYFAEHPRANLHQVLAASLDRRFSASPNERFYTGGGLHTFVNFDSKSNGQVMTVREGLRHSVNLVFIRVMQEIVRYHEATLGYDRAALLADRDHPQRRILLEEYVQAEGRKTLWQAFDRYRGQGLRESLTQLLGRRLTPRGLAVVYYYRHGPNASREGLEKSLVAMLGESAIEDGKLLDRLVRGYGRNALNLGDAAYLLHVHPLDLWAALYLADHPDATGPELADASKPAIDSGYRWLFGKRARRAQDLRIRILLEKRAFEQIHRVWQRLGYPFGTLVPSLATSIGSSADRPAALAELIGIILRGGERAPIQRVSKLDFAGATPYETTMEPVAQAPKQVMPLEVAQALRGCLEDVVEHGTAVRAFGAVRRPDGEIIPIGGKTGSGDNRVERFGRGGQLKSSRVVSRTASFVFFIGDRFFGVATAFVSGREAENYGFTSSLPVQIVKNLGPALTPLITAPHPMASFTTASAADPARTTP